MCGKLVSSSSQITSNSQNNTNTSSNSKVVQPIATSETFNPPKSTNECNYSHEELMKFEETLKTYSYLSKADEPSQNEDAAVLIELEKTRHMPDNQKYPNLHGWYWHLAAIRPTARAVWRLKGSE